MARVTLSRKNQVVVPPEVRQALHVKAGDKLKVVVRGDVIIVLQKPKSHRKAISGLASGRFPAGYLRKERRNWD